MFKLLTSRSKTSKKGLLADQNAQANQKSSVYDNQYNQGNRGLNHIGKPLPDSPAYKGGYSNNINHKDDMTSVLNNLPPLKSSNVQFTQFSPASAFKSPKMQTKLLGQQGKKLPLTHQLQNMMVPPTEIDNRRNTSYQPQNRDSSFINIPHVAPEAPRKSPGHRMSTPSISTVYHERGDLKKHESHEPNTDNYHPNLSKSPFSKRASRLDMLSPSMYEAPKELEDELKLNHNLRKPLPHKPSFGRSIVSEGMERQRSEGTPRVEKFGEPMRHSTSTPASGSSVQRTSQKPKWKFLEEMRKEATITNKNEMSKKNSSPLAQPPLVSSDNYIAKLDTPIEATVVQDFNFESPKTNTVTHPSRSKEEKALDAKVMLAAGLAAKENETRSLRRFVQAAEVQQRSRLRMELNTTTDQPKPASNNANLEDPKRPTNSTGSGKFEVKIEGSLKSRSNAKIEAEAKDYFKNEPWLQNLITTEIQSGSNSLKAMPDSSEAKPKINEVFNDSPLQISTKLEGSYQSKLSEPKSRSILSINSTRWARNRASNASLKELVISEIAPIEKPTVESELENARLTSKKGGSFIWNRSISKVFKSQEEKTGSNQLKLVQDSDSPDTVDTNNDSDDDEVLVAVRRRCLTRYSGNLTDLAKLPPVSGRDPSLPIPRDKKTITQIRSLEPLASNSSNRNWQSTDKKEVIRPKTVVENLRNRFEMKILEAGSTPNKKHGIVESASMSNLKAFVAPKSISKSKFTNISNRPKTMFDLHSQNQISEPVDMTRNQLSVNLDEITNVTEDSPSKMALAWKASALSRRGINKNDEKMSGQDLTLLESLEPPSKDNSNKLSSMLNPWKSKSPLDSKLATKIFEANPLDNREMFKPTHITVNRVSVPNSELNLIANASSPYQVELSEAKAQIENWKKKYRDEQFAKERMEANFNEKRERELSMHLEEVENIKNVCSRRCRELIHVIRELQDLNLSYSLVLEQNGIHPQLIQPADPKLLQEPTIDPLFTPGIKTSKFKAQSEAVLLTDVLAPIQEHVQQDSYDGVRLTQTTVGQSSPSNRRKNSETLSFIVRSPSLGGNNGSLRKKQVGSLTPITMYKFIEEQYKKIVQNPLTSPLQASLKIPSPTIRLPTISASSSDLNINQIGESFKLNIPTNKPTAPPAVIPRLKSDNSESKVSGSGRSYVKDRIASLLSSIERTATAIELEASHLGLNASSGHTLKRPSSTASILSLKNDTNETQTFIPTVEPKNRYNSTSPKFQLSPMRSFPTLSIHSVASDRSSSETPVAIVPLPPAKSSSLHIGIESSVNSISQVTSNLRQKENSDSYKPVDEPIDLSGLQQSLKAVAARSSTNLNLPISTNPTLTNNDFNKPTPPPKHTNKQTAATMRNLQPADLNFEHSGNYYMGSRTTPRLRNGESDDPTVTRKPLPKLPPST